MGKIAIGLNKVAAHILGGTAHLLANGDSQSIGSHPRMWVQWPRTCPLHYHYIVLDPANTTATAMGNNLGFGGTVTDAGNTRDNTSYGALTTGPNGIFRPARCNTQTGNTTDGSLIGSGSGFTLNRCIQAGGDGATLANMGCQWPSLDDNLVSGVARPWYHGTYVKCKSMWYTCTNQLTTFMQSFNRAGKSATDVVSANAATPLTGGTTIKGTPWTLTRADDGDYDVLTGGTGIYNDHDIQYRLYAAAGIDETGKVLIPVGAIVARCDSGGTIPWNEDGSGASFDHFGISGSYVNDWLNNYGTQTHWQEYFTQTVLAPAARTVLAIMLGHNMRSGTDYSGDTCLDLWRTEYESYINMLIAAHQAAFPSGEVLPLIIVPWRSGQQSAMQGLALAQSAQAQVERMCTDNGWSMFSFFEYFDQQAPFHMLHPTTIAEAEKLCNALRDTLDRETSFAYSRRGAVASRGALRGRG